MEMNNRTDKKIVGDKGEELATKYLEAKGYRVLDRNFRCKMGELDVIAYSPDERVLAFVEVKTRNSVEYGLPSEFVNAKKQRCLLHTANYYLMCHKGLASLQPRMDVFEIIYLKEGVFVRHLKNAF